MLLIRLILPVRRVWRIRVALKVIWSVVWLNDSGSECYWTINYVDSDVVAICTGDLVRAILAITLSPH